LSVALVMGVVVAATGVAVMSLAYISHVRQCSSSNVVFLRARFVLQTVEHRDDPDEDGTC